MLEDHRGGIVPALDTPSLDEAVKLVAAIDDVPGVVGYKFGMGATLDHGLGPAVRRLRAVTKRPLIYDHQKAGPDVASMAERFAAICARCGVDAAVLFPLGGPTVADAFVKNCQAQGIAPIVGGDLPEKDARVSTGGYIADDALARIFDRVSALGVRDYVVPATEPERIRSLTSSLQERVGHPNVFMPGVGALGGAIEAAAEALSGCRPFFIVGRGIWRADDPRTAAAEYAAAMDRVVGHV